MPENAAPAAAPAAPSDEQPAAAPRRGMVLSPKLCWFFTAFGVWSWIIWITFEKNLVKDASGLAFDHGHATAYFYIHTALAIVSFLLGTAIGIIGLRGLRAARRNR